jgi:hypothetical protein
MNQAIGTILAGTLIAGSILLINRWQIALGPVQNMPNPQVYRLDRWTGKCRDMRSKPAGVTSRCWRPIPMREAPK